MDLFQWVQFVYSYNIIRTKQTWDLVAPSAHSFLYHCSFFIASLAADILPALYFMNCVVSHILRMIILFSIMYKSFTRSTKLFWLTQCHFLVSRERLYMEISLLIIKLVVYRQVIKTISNYLKCIQWLNMLIFIRLEMYYILTCT